MTLCCKLKRSKWDLWRQRYFYLRTWAHLHLVMDGHFQGEYISMVRTVKCLFHRLSLCFQMVVQRKNVVLAIFLFYCRYIWLTKHLISGPRSRFCIFHLKITFISPHCSYLICRRWEIINQSKCSFLGLKDGTLGYIPKIWTMVTLLVWDLSHMINLYMLAHNCIQEYKWKRGNIGCNWLLFLLLFRPILDKFQPLSCVNLYLINFS